MESTLCNSSPPVWSFIHTHLCLQPTCQK